MLARRYTTEEIAEILQSTFVDTKTLYSYVCISYNRAYVKTQKKIEAHFKNFTYYKP